MNELFLRTVSQGLQAFMPVAVGVSWLRRHGCATARASLAWGIVVAIAATPVAGYWFKYTVHQARWEAVLAEAAAGLAFCFLSEGGRVLWSACCSSSNRRLRFAWGVALAGAVVLLMTRQTMEIDVVFVAAAFEVRSLDATVAVSAGVAAALAMAVGYVWLSRRFSAPALVSATRAFGGIFLGQALIYAFHESAEAGLLPWSPILHAASEPYGPDGIYGRNLSYVLVVLPVLAAVVAGVGARRAAPSPTWRERVRARPRWTWALMSALGAACVLLMWMYSRAGVLPSGEGVAVAAAGDASAIAAGPRLLYQRTGVDAARNLITLSALEPPGARPVAVPLSCERVSFAAGRGLCLQAERGLFTTYKAVLIDAAMKPRGSIKLEGRPSRSRVSADGRLGAITVFVRGAAHGYAGSAFSTKTTLIDMTTGDELGDLEQFSTWRDGMRIHAADFNFWGVTFDRGSNSNVFYATLKTAGNTHLVRGDLGLRKLVVVHDNVECPSLSPDNQLIAYKKRMGPSLSPWRIYVLDIATMTERAVSAEVRSVDDQIEWLDDAHVLYALPRSSQTAVSDVWMAPIDGSAPARIFVEQALSPIVIR
jgi:hypothetical protein